MIQYFSIIVILIGVYGLLTQRNLIKIIVSLNVFDVGLNIFIVSVGYVKGGAAPILSDISNSSALNFVDPLPQALVLTSIVIGMGTTALALAYARKMHVKYNTFELDEMEAKEDD